MGSLGYLNLRQIPKIVAILDKLLSSKLFQVSSVSSMLSFACLTSMLARIMKISIPGNLSSKLVTSFTGHCSSSSSWILPLFALYFLHIWVCSSWKISWIQVSRYPLPNRTFGVPLDKIQSGSNIHLKSDACFSCPRTMPESVWNSVCLMSTKALISLMTLLVSRTPRTASPGCSQLFNSYSFYSTSE